MMTAWIRFNSNDYCVTIVERTNDRVYIEYADGCQEWIGIEDYDRYIQTYQDYHNDK